MKKHKDTILSNCDREPIHLINHIQPFGTLLVLDEKSLKVIQCAKNASEYLAFTETFIGKKISFLIGKELEQSIANFNLGSKNRLEFSGKVNATQFSFVAYKTKQGILLEVERFTISDPIELQDQLTTITEALGSSDSALEACQNAANIVRKIFNYDRVLVYRFDKDWNGEVIAECKQKDQTSWLGLHYPATDIPQPARALFLKQKIRIIADVDYQPIIIEPQLNPTDQKIVDLSNSELRGVSPVHLQYLKNMGVNASLTTSIIIEGKLWGLITCHHNAAKTINRTQRQLCSILVEIFTNKINSLNYKAAIKANQERSKIVEQLKFQIDLEKDWSNAFLSQADNLLDLFNAQALIILQKNRTQIIGEKINKDFQIRISQFLKHQKSGRLVSSKLSLDYPKYFTAADSWAGLLSLKLNGEQNNTIVWLRKEKIQQVNWGGKPKKPEKIIDGIAYLNPRTSFAKWSKQVEGHSEEWDEEDLKSIKIIKELLQNHLLQQQQNKIKTLNKRLKQNNKDLKAFSYSVSHDLRSPLRGIEGFTNMLLEKPGIDASTEQIGNKILHSVNSMNNLIDGILKLATLNLKEIKRQNIKVRDLVLGYLEEINFSNKEGILIQIEEEIPDLTGDFILIKQVFTNLIDNALKYTQHNKDARIVIGYSTQKNAYFVKDNGIGIHPSAQKKIFKLFQRSSAALKNFEGEGIGLALVKKIVKKHNGKIFIDSEVDKYSIFYIQLPS